MWRTRNVRDFRLVEDALDVPPITNCFLESESVPDRKVRVDTRQVRDYPANENSGVITLLPLGFEEQDPNTHPIVEATGGH
jgi:hypothetical protein